MVLCAQVLTFDEVNDSGGALLFVFRFQFSGMQLSNVEYESLSWN